VIVTRIGFSNVSKPRRPTGHVFAVQKRRRTFVTVISLCGTIVTFGQNGFFVRLEIRTIGPPEQPCCLPYTIVLPERTKRDGDFTIRNAGTDRIRTVVAKSNETVLAVVVVSSDRWIHGFGFSISSGRRAYVINEHINSAYTYTHTHTHTHTDIPRFPVYRDHCI